MVIYEDKAKRPDWPIGTWTGSPGPPQAHIAVPQGLGTACGTCLTLCDGCNNAQWKTSDITTFGIGNNLNLINGFPFIHFGTGMEK